MMTVWYPTKSGLGRSDGRGAVIDLSLSLTGERGYIPRVRLADGRLVSLNVRETLGAAQAAVLKYYGAGDLPPAEKPEQPMEANVSANVSEIQALAAQIAALTEQVSKLTAGSPEERREKQAEVQKARRYEAVWRDLGAPNGYVHPSGRARVEWNGRRWVAYVDGRKLRKSYRQSYNARVAAGIKLAAKVRAGN
jgi:hypothetical protein